MCQSGRKKRRKRRSEARGQGRCVPASLGSKSADVTAQLSGKDVKSLL